MVGISCYEGLITKIVQIVQIVQVVKVTFGRHGTGQLTPMLLAARPIFDRIDPNSCCHGSLQQATSACRNKVSSK